MKYVVILEHDPQGECRWVGRIRHPDDRKAEVGAEDLVDIFREMHAMIAENIGMTITGRFGVGE